MRAAWATDVHFEFVEEERFDRFLAELCQARADCVLLTGDIGMAMSTQRHLRRIADAIERPVYFVLGNHDFYRDSVADVREEMEHLCETIPNLHWMGNVGVVGLSPHTALVGHDGWADGRLGDYAASDVELSDYYVIREFRGLDKDARLDQLQRLAAESAAHFRRFLPQALERHRAVVALTHVPPFRDACWHRGRISSDDWLPHFSSKVAGDAMAEVMRAHPDRELLVLCGHTHGEGEAQILPNLRVLTGGATYGEPEVQRVFDFV